MNSVNGNGIAVAVAVAVVAAAAAAAASLLLNEVNTRVDKFWNSLVPQMMV